MEKCFDFDVIVCGGGLSGVAAAIAASRSGAKTLIIERYGFLGGAATNSLVNPFMEYINDASTWINKGIFSQILKRLDNMGGLFYGNKATFNEEYLKVILDELTEENNISVLFHSFVAKVNTDGNNIKSVIAAGKSGLMEFKAKYYIDATGDGDIASFSGCKTVKGNEDGYCQPMSLNFRLCDVDRTQFAPMFPGKQTDLKGVNSKEITRNLIALYKEFKKEGKIKNPREDVQTFPCMVEHMIHFNSTRVIMKDATDSFELSDAERIARKQMMELFGFLKDNVPAFRESSLVMSGAQIGVRESRRLVGKYVLTAEDLLSCTKFSDSIARGIYNIDVHNPCGSGTTLKAIPKNDYYTIPMRSLIPNEIDNLIVCGRPISSTFEAHSAIRVMPITTCIGEGAGTVISIASKNNIKISDVESSDVQKILSDYDQVY